MLYHASIGFPRNIRALPERIELRYGRHARQAAQDDRYGPVRWLPSVIDTAACKLVEAEVEADGTVTKAVLRLSLGTDLDLVLVVHPRDGFVRTVWQNRRSDAHRTLNTARYARAD